MQFRQGHRKEALIHLANSVQTLQRSGAHVDAARAALDYVVAAQGASDPSIQPAIQMLDYALKVLERVGSPRDLQTARSIARQVGYESTGVTPRG